MRRAILAFLLLLSFAFPLPAHTRPNFGIVLAATRPIGTWVIAPDGDEYAIQHFLYCTATSINSKGYWITAAHCIQPEMNIDMHTATVLYVNTDDDLAVIQTPGYSVRPLPMADVAPQLADEVWFVGHGFGFETPMLYNGIVASLNLHFIDGGYDYGWKMMFDAPVCKGQSGSSVLNERGEIISIISIGTGGDICSPGSGGTTWTNMQKVREYFEAQHVTT